MPDELNVPKPEERERINVSEYYELRDWAIYFSVSQEKIRAAVSAVGPFVEDVKRYLGK